MANRLLYRFWSNYKSNTNNNKIELIKLIPLLVII